MKRILIISSIALLSTTINAQNFYDKFYRSRGCSLMLFSNTSTISQALTEVSESPPEYTEANGFIEQHFLGYGIGYIQSFRYNLVEFDKEKSLSLEMPITLGLSFSDNKNFDALTTVAYGNINIPLLLQFNVGIGSTYKSSSNTGFVIGLGYEFNLHPIITSFGSSPIKPSKGDYVQYNQYYYKYEGFNSTWFEPVAQLGIRFWNRNNKLKEINIKYGFGTKEEWFDVDDNTTKSHSPFYLQVNFLTIVNY